jgi:WD40-like Beta Propeller Repeat
MKFSHDRLSLLYSILALALLFSACNSKNSNETTLQNDLIGPYLGQELPDTTPRIFAPGIVSTEMYERDLAISSDGSEIYYTVLSKSMNNRRSTIILVKQIDGIWMDPEVAPFSGKYSDVEPFIQYDGKKLYFVSDRPLVVGKDNEYKYNIWYIEKTAQSWSNPKPIGEPINGHGSVFYPSITKSGTMYFTRRNDDESEYIYRSKTVDGNFTNPEILPENVNSTKAQFNALISPDESFLIIPTVVENNTFGSSDYYVSFRDKDDNWSELINLGKNINSKNWDFSPSLSPDGKYFFFQRDTWNEGLEGRQLNYNDLLNIHNGGGDIYWVDASVITRLNPMK